MSLSCSAEAINPQKCLLIALIEQLRKIYTNYYFLRKSSIASRAAGVGGGVSPPPPPQAPGGGKKFSLVSLFLSLRDPYGAYAIWRHYLMDDFFVPASLFLSFLPENLLDTTSPAGRM